MGGKHLERYAMYAHRLIVTYDSLHSLGEFPG
jgi:hypothetical protein